MPDPIEIRTLTDGGQAAEDIAAELVSFLADARETLELALYDVRLPGPVGDSVHAALVGACERGVKVRLAYNLDHPKDVFEPPPPRTEPNLVESLPLPTKAIPGTPDLMHHKYVIRDREAVWTGSTNWTLDSWTREENVLVRVASPGLAMAYIADFEDLWRRGRVEDSGARPTPEVGVGGARVRAWFSPGRGPELSQRIADAIARARRVRIASPLITAAPILRALGAKVGEGHDVTGVVDATQVAQVFRQWGGNPNAQWKSPLLRRILEQGGFHGKRSTPYAPGAVHDYMHAKITICDDVTFVGSFNLSHSGEQNAENVVEIHDAGIAARMSAFVDEVQARYPAIAP